MSSTEDKFNLVREAAQLLMKQEFRGGLLTKFQPKVSIVVDKDEPDSGYKYTHTSIRLEYPNDKVGEPTNWSGIGDSVDDALSSNLVCIELEIEDRLLALQDMLEQVKKALPDKFKPRK